MINIEEIFYIVMALLVVFLLTIDYALAILPIFILIFLSIIIKKNGKVLIPKTFYLFTLLLLFVLFQIIIEPSQYYSLDIAKKELFRISIYIILVLIIANLKIRKKLFLIIWSIIFIILFLISLFQLYDLFSINDLLGIVYWDSIHLEVSKKYSDLSNFRAGSVFINFNNYAQFIAMMLAIFLYYRYENKISRKLFIIIFIITIINLILTGSRTGFLVSILLIMITLLLHYYKKNLTLLNYIRNIIILIVIILIIIIIFFDLELANYRLLQVSQGIDNSLNYKYGTFLNMIKEMNIIQFIIGFGPYDYQDQFIDQVDFDLGNILTYYGLVGLMFYLYFIYFTFNKAGKSKKRNNLLLFLLIIVFTLTSLTSGMFFNLRIFSILLLLISINFTDEEIN